MRGGQSSSFLVTAIVEIKRKDTDRSYTGLTCSMLNILVIHIGSHFVEEEPWKIGKLMKIINAFYILAVCTKWELEIFHVEWEWPFSASMRIWWNNVVSEIIWLKYHFLAALSDNISLEILDYNPPAAAPKTAPKTVS